MEVSVASRPVVKPADGGAEVATVSEKVDIPSKPSLVNKVSDGGADGELSSEAMLLNVSKVLMKVSVGSRVKVSASVVNGMVG